MGCDIITIYGGNSGEEALEDEGNGKLRLAKHFIEHLLPYAYATNLDGYWWFVYFTSHITRVQFLYDILVCKNIKLQVFEKKSDSS